MLILDELIRQIGIRRSFFLIYLFFIFDCVGSLLLRRLFSSCGEWGLLIAVHGLLVVLASLVVEHGP